MTTLLLPASLDNLSLRKDGSILLKFETREMSGQEISDILGFRNTLGWMQFSQNSDFRPPPKENAVLDIKSPSERLRDVIFIYYKQGLQDKTFETFYSEYMEKIINSIKLKLK